MIKVKPRQLRDLKRDLSGQSRKMAAIRITTKRIAKEKEGHVIVSKRKKESWEKGRQAHGRVIAANLRRLGHPVFDHDKKLMRRINTEIKSEVSGLLQRAAQRKKSQKTTELERRIRRGTQRLVMETKSRIRNGKIGSHPRAYKNRKVSLVMRGRGTVRYGMPPPYGVLTGRFMDGIRWRMRRPYRGNSKR